MQKGATITSDTIRIKIPVFVPQVRSDTTFVIVPGDTVVLKKDRLTVKYISLRDTVFLSGECAADTVIREVPVTVTHTIAAPSKIPWWIWGIIVGLCMVVLRLVFK